MMKQWAELKAKAGSALLFFRLGDFYELFEEDALKAAPLLGVTLTSRNSKADTKDAIPLCGIPVSQLELYLPRLLDRNLKVALAEQVEEPQPGKTLVRREIVQWFTPGMRLLRGDDRIHLVAVIDHQGRDWSLAACDIATGHLTLDTQTSWEALLSKIQELNIKDLRWNLPMPEHSLTLFHEEAPYVDESEWNGLLLRGFGVSSTQDLPPLSRLYRKTLAQLLRVIEEAHPRERLRFLHPQLSIDNVWMSQATKKNLHLFEPDGLSLFDILNHCMTACGRRTLKQWMNHPIRHKDHLKSRQTTVAFFKSRTTERTLLRKKLSQILDLHRLLRRRRTPREILSFADSLKAGISTALLLQSPIPLLQQFSTLSDSLRSLGDELERCIEPHQRSLEASSLEPQIARGVHPIIDELRAIRDDSRSLLMQLEARLRDSLGISSLKIKFHQTFGYVIEITAAHKSKIPDSAKRIQSLTNGERFKTDELEALEQQILSCTSRLQDAEDAEWSRLNEAIEAHYSSLISWLDILGQIDAAQSLADVSSHYNWTTPHTCEQRQTLLLTQAKHPLVRGQFIPFDLSMSPGQLQVLLLTGPNMAGKSTVLRTVCLMAYLHQIGCDLPAQSASLSLFDRILCRMGASDDLTNGQSTFLFEMREVASILQGASEESLLAFDEIGRGTSTFDGMSLSWAVTKHVAGLGALSLMATHYLELAELEALVPTLRAYHLGVELTDNKLIFTRELLSGPASRSYGIHVARMADLPESILQVAEDKLREFERKRAQRIPVLELWS